jgi:hypothetical protein
MVYAIHLQFSVSGQLHTCLFFHETQHNTGSRSIVPDILPALDVGDAVRGRDDVLGVDEGGHAPPDFRNPTLTIQGKSVLSASLTLPQGKSKRNVKSEFYTYGPTGHTYLCTYISITFPQV